MKLLPTIDEVEIPTYFSPSRLSVSGGCLLNVVLGSRGNVIFPLIPHPKAELGTVFHRLLEMASKRAIKRKDCVERDVEDALEFLLSETEGRLSADPLKCIYADLKMTMSNLDWTKKTRMFVDAATKLLESSSNRGSDGKPEKDGGGEYKDLPEVGRWSEVKIVAPRLRLRGRMDVVEKNAGSVSIRDLKTGSIEDGAGQVLHHIENQMQLYGLMVAETEKGRKRIRLFVDHADELEIPFDADVIASVEDRLSAILEKLPEGATKKTDEIAVPDEGCRYCSYRHRCGSYLKDALGKWVSGSDYMMPPDVWGRIEKIEPHLDSNALTIRDAAGRTVKIFGLRDALVAKIDIGINIWLFGLSTKGFGYDGGTYRHPLNFFENDPSNPWSRAWSLQVFHD